MDYTQKEKILSVLSEIRGDLDRIGEAVNDRRLDDAREVLKAVERDSRLLQTVLAAGR